MKKVAFYTLGCKLNFSETSSISRLFEDNGFVKSNFEDRSDIYVINTCSVTENANKKCRKVVKEALKHSPDAYVVIIGCYAQLKPKEISEIPGVDAVLGAAEKFRLIEILGEFEKKESPTVLASEIKEAARFNHSYSLKDRTRTFLKVQDGCNYNCSFCTIPLARGKSRSDTIQSIILSANEIAQTEVKEVVLTGVNIGDFGIINGKRQESFIDLLLELDQVQGIDRFRISSIEPNLLTEDIIEFCAQSKKFVPHFHIPLQSGSDKMLKLMRRRYDRQLYTDRINLINKIIPDCCIGVDVIVGHPDESDDDFLETYNYLNELNISYLHVFTYSERENTHSLEINNVVPGSIRADRSKQLRSLSDKKKRHFYETQIGNTGTVLFENDIENGMVSGFTENYVRVKAKYDPILINEFKEVKIIDIDSDGICNIIDVNQEILKH